MVQKMPSTEEKIDVIVEYLRRMDQRDRLRMWGGTIRSILGLIPLLITVWLFWYLYAHGGDFMNQIIERAASQAAVITGQSQGAILKQLQQNGLIEQIQKLLQ